MAGTAAQGARRWLIFGEAVVALALAALAVRLLPFRRAVRTGSVPLGSAGGGIDRIRWSVEAAARRVPWRAVCFQQGIAAQAMLRRRGVDARLHYGVGTPDDDLGAHVWVTVGPDVVIGGEQVRQFAALATFP